MTFGLNILKTITLIFIGLSTAHCSDSPDSLINTLPGGGNEKSGDGDVITSAKTLKLKGQRLAGGLPMGTCLLYITQNEDGHYSAQVETQVHHGAVIRAMELQIWNYALADSDGDGFVDKQVFTTPEEPLDNSQLVLAGVTREDSGESLLNPANWIDYEDDGTLKQYALIQFSNNSFVEFDQQLAKSLEDGNLTESLNVLSSLNMQIKHGNHADPVECNSFKSEEITTYNFDFGSDDHDHDGDHDHDDDHDHDHDHDDHDDHN